MKPHYLNRRARFVLVYHGLGIYRVELQYRLKWWRWYFWKSVAADSLWPDAEFEKIKHRLLKQRTEARREKASQRKFLKHFFP
jgi:hypothetical protein